MGTMRSAPTGLSLELNKLSPIASSVLRCEPTVEMQLICLLGAAACVWLFLRLAQGLIGFWLRRSSIKNKRVREYSDIMENMDFYTIALNLAYDMYVLTTHPKLYISGKVPTYAQVSARKLMPLSSP